MLMLYCASKCRNRQNLNSNCRRIRRLKGLAKRIEIKPARRRSIKSVDDLQLSSNSNSQAIYPLRHSRRYSVRIVGSAVHKNLHCRHISSSHQFQSNGQFNHSSNRSRKALNLNINQGKFYNR